MALADQAALGLDPAFISKVKVLLVAKALTVATADVRPAGQANEQEIKLAAAVLKDPNAWAALGAVAAAAQMTGAITGWPAPELAVILPAQPTDAALRATMLQGAKSVWLSLGGTV